MIRTATSPLHARVFGCVRCAACSFRVLKGPLHLSVNVRRDSGFTVVSYSFPVEVEGEQDILTHSLSLCVLFFFCRKVAVLSQQPLRQRVTARLCVPVSLVFVVSLLCEMPVSLTVFHTGARVWECVGAVWCGAAWCGKEWGCIGKLTRDARECFLTASRCCACPRALQLTPLLHYVLPKKQPGPSAEQWFFV